MDPYTETEWINDVTQASTDNLGKIESQLTLLTDAVIDLGEQLTGDLGGYALRSELGVKVDGIAPGTTADLAGALAAADPTWGVTGFVAVKVA